MRALEIEWADRIEHMLYLDMPTNGDASESGLIKFFQPIEDVQTIREMFPVVRDHEDKECRLPFNSTNKYAFSINHYQTEDSHYCLFLKGAPEKIWKMCNFIDLDGRPVAKSSAWEKKFFSSNEKFGKNG